LTRAYFSQIPEIAENAHPKPTNFQNRNLSLRRRFTSPAVKTCLASLSPQPLIPISKNPSADCSLILTFSHNGVNSSKSQWRGAMRMPVRIPESFVARLRFHLAPLLACSLPL
jgi:hypothetical protein